MVIFCHTIGDEYRQFNYIFKELLPMKRLFLYVVISNIILLNNMFSVHAMELSLEVKKGVEIDWARKKRDMRSSYCWVEKNDKKYPYFLEKDEGNAKFSLVSDTKII